jgi:hypothetical protein
MTGAILVRANISVDVTKEVGLKNVAWMSFMVRCVTAFGRERGFDDWPGPPAPAPADRTEELEDAQLLERDCFAFRRASWTNIRSPF